MSAKKIQSSQAPVSSDDSHGVVLDYLNQISDAISILTEDPEYDSTNGSCECCVERIARGLMLAFDPANLSLPIPPSILPRRDDEGVSESARASGDCSPSEIRRFQTRLDILRCILRSMPPIAVDVCARAAASVVFTLTQSGPSRSHSLSAFILFATWLPIAPQLAPIVSDLFKLDFFPSPFDLFEEDSNDDDDVVMIDVEETGGFDPISPSRERLIIAEAAHSLCRFHASRGEHRTMQGWWNWSGLFGLLYAPELKDEGQHTVNRNSELDGQIDWLERPYLLSMATRWHAARAVTYLIDLRPSARAAYLKRAGVEGDMVPWLLHPWVVEEEEERAQASQLAGVAAVYVGGGVKQISLPSVNDIRRNIPVHSSTVNIGGGILLAKRSSIVPSKNPARSHSRNPGLPSGSRQSSSGRQYGPQHLILTATTSQNLSILGAALCSYPHPPPILVCGPTGSGKSSLVRELARFCSSANCHGDNSDQLISPSDELLELHIDEETDSKTLLGCYAATDVPGEFAWRPGALTTAVRTGKWVLLEDVDSCPAEIQAALVQLFKQRILPLGGRRDERCHPNFRLFGTCTTSISTDHVNGFDSSKSKRRPAIANGVAGRRIFHPNLWRRVHVDPIPFSELREISQELYPFLPLTVLDAALNVLRVLDQSGRVEGGDCLVGENSKRTVELSDPGILRVGNFGNWGGRQSSVRDYMKLLSRVAHNIKFEPGVQFATESQRTLCLAETIDIFAASIPSVMQRRDFVVKVAVPTWDVSVDLAVTYVEARRPTFETTDQFVTVGRAAIPNSISRVDKTPGNFADTSYALRLMESIGVCISQNEPTLLVGETGCGKTTLVQRLAVATGRELIVQNLSLQTDSTDLLGGYRPLEIRTLARRAYLHFVEIFVSSFSRSQNAEFLAYVSEAFEKGHWKRLSQCFRRASKMGQKKMRGLEANKHESGIEERLSSFFSTESWESFHAAAERFERQRVAGESGLAFAFTEGALVDAIRTGKWVLLDEINLASSETLERLCGLLDDGQGSLTLTERGDTEALQRHKDFRILAAMNPATDTGKKDLPASIRARFTEIYVDELVESSELRTVAARYLSRVVAAENGPLEQSNTVTSAVDVYLELRLLSDQSLVDGSGQKPRYTLRTLCRSLSAARNFVLDQKFSPQRAILEGFELVFEGPLDSLSRALLSKTLSATLSKNFSRKDLDHPGRRPGSKDGGEHYILMKPFWIKGGPCEAVDWSKQTKSNGRTKFVLTPSAKGNLRQLSRAVAAGPWPVLLEGPTSAGKTSLVEYMAARCGHRCVRINNHEHTDLQEYTGCYASDSSGKLVFQEGILVQALRNGHWVILDELNLAPSEVLEALNRLLDDNRELYLPEINETVTPHPNFKLFATQNPSGIYGGRKPLSRAFRNRFVEINISDIPSNEMVSILELRCGCPPTYAKLLVKVMTALRQRRSQSGVFRGKDGLITPRDLLRWAERGGSSKSDLAMEGYMLLAERLRSDEEKEIVRCVIEEQLRVSIDCEAFYYAADSKARIQLDSISKGEEKEYEGLSLHSIAPTRSMLRLLTLVNRCVKQKEPVLLVGETGCGKTTVVQLLSIFLKRRLDVINCHASSETSDLLGGLRPVRGRQELLIEMVAIAINAIESCADEHAAEEAEAPAFLLQKRVENGSYPPDAALQTLQFLERLSRTHKSCEDSKDVSAKTELSYKQNEKKRRKLGEGKRNERGISNAASAAYNSVRGLYQKYNSLFEWVDGPLVTSMRSGNLLLLDEMSLAEDAVLERLNSVLEPSRTLTLAEKGGDDEPVSATGTNTGSEIKAHDDFRIFATMNPGGDFGKRELSPALRSRFTEIWVPAVTDRLDIDLVLERTISSAVKTRLQNEHPLVRLRENIRESMLNYVEFFNQDICGDSNSPFSDFALSLRDILAWARFVVEVCCKTSQDTNIWLAYTHGASLMHLDGLGLGTGVTNYDSSSVRLRAKKFLVDHVPVGDQDACCVGFMDESSTDGTYLSHATKLFGVHPFAIPVGPEPLPENLSFNLHAPTTGVNLRRILRAMQINKPILLEGSPGVGKTSLISAFAVASGHRLVRINLSEQTDISDLMGSDLPTSGDESSTDETGGTGSFKWCDGVLLRAIKQGDWVLLDELNLASQSVLEGLNSCLDHRSSVYIPELGLTFDCPATFRIFAAQNPLAQGGGRKGLPKSFLNRFTKVYFDSLTPDDLRSIVSTRFPIIPATLVDQMVTFNNLIQADVVERGEYGQLGSPWEFNLRDIFRWCQLLLSNRNDQTLNAEVAGDYVETIYIQRLRAQYDRDMLSKRFEETFQVSLSSPRLPSFEITDDFVRIGNAVLRRDVASPYPIVSLPLQGTEPGIGRGLMRSAQSIAHCVRMNWPVLLVGSESSGKSNLLRFLSESCNFHLEEIALTQSSDVNELVGTFEQVDAAEYSIQLLHNLEGLYEVSCQLLASNNSDVIAIKTISRSYFRMKKALAGLRDEISLFENKLVWSTIQHLIANFEKAAEVDERFNTVCSIGINSARNQFDAITKHKARGEGSTSSLFRWTDGVLVKAMQAGYWLHFKNVNYCSSSVLDRLNPLMEGSGELVLTECGAGDGDNEAGSSTCRVVKPHPNFKLFLSMDSTSGEVSRAMRNRCVEISFLSPSIWPDKDYDAAGQNGEQGCISHTKMPPDKFLDLSDVLYRSGLLSHKVVAAMLDSHELARISSSGDLGAPSLHTLQEWGSIASGLLRRGLDATKSIEISHVLAYEVYGADARLLDAVSSFSTEDEFITRLPPTRETMIFSPLYYQLLASACLIKRLLRLSGSGESLMLDTLLALRGDNDLSSRYQNLVLSPRSEGFNLPYWLPDDAVASFVASASDYNSTIVFFSGYSEQYKSKATTAATAITQAIETFELSPVKTKELFQWYRSHKSLGGGVISYLLVYCLDRLPQLIREEKLYEGLRSADVNIVRSKKLMAIEASFLIHEGNFSTGKCLVTPVLYPLFVALDDFLSSLHCILVDKDLFDSEIIFSAKKLLSSRDRMWISLANSPHQDSLTHSGLLGFDEEIFIVHWTWFKKALKRFYYICLGSIASELEARTESRLSKRHFELLVHKIDQAIFDNAGDITAISESLWKKGGHPQVPSLADDWIAIEKILSIARSSSFLIESRFGFISQMSGSSKQIDLELLVKEEHPYLFLEPRLRDDIIGALSMAFWATTDEMRENKGERLKRQYKTAETAQILSDQVDNKRARFLSLKRLATVDFTIDTVENQLDIEDLKLLSSDAFETSEEDDIMEVLLSRFSAAQVTQVAEIWCTEEELGIIARIVDVASTLLKGEELDRSECQHLAMRIKFFMKTALSCEILWPSCDLRAYQTLVWVLETTNLKDWELSHLLDCLLPRMSIVSSSHVWCNSFNSLDMISPNLVYPSSFWNSQEDNDLETNESGITANLSIDFGPMRVKQHVRDTAFFRLLGYSISGAPQQIPHLTLENSCARENQARTLFRTLSRLRSSQDIKESGCLSQISFSFARVIFSLKNSFTNANVALALVSFILGGGTLTHESAKASFDLCYDTKLRGILAKVGLPLIDIIHDVRTSKAKEIDERLAIARVYLGLVIFHLMIPVSPLDPGKKPAAKISELDVFHQSLSSQLTILSLESGIARGEFAPSSEKAFALLGDAELVLKKKENQERKRVERPADALPYVQFFQECRHFAKTIANMDHVLSLMQLIQSDSEKAMMSEINWQSNASAYTNRLCSHFSPYEDVTIPLIDAIDTLRGGLRQLSYFKSKCNQTTQTKIVELSDRLLRFPVGNIFSSLNVHRDLEVISRAFSSTGLSSTVSSHRVLGKVTTNCQLSVLLAALARAVTASICRVRYGLLDDHTRQATDATFASIVKAWQKIESDAAQNADDSKGENHVYGVTESDEEKMEKLLRDQFPDHSSEFCSIIHSVEESGEDGNNVSVAEVATEVEIENVTLSKEQVWLLSKLHREVYAVRPNPADDRSRLRAFLLSYEAASLLGYVSGNTEKVRKDIWSTGAHVMALSTRKGKTEHGHIFLENSDTTHTDFHNDPNPLEVAKASACLKQITRRIAQLLRAFPGNAILLAVGRVVEHTRRLNLDTTSVGKALAGLEVILRKANEWEQHASERVKFGGALQNVSRLVVQWRKLELQSWSTLLDIRESHHRKKAQRHFLRLHLLVHDFNDESESAASQLELATLETSPHWVWKGLTKAADSLSAPPSISIAIDEQFLDLIKALDSFFLTAGLGDFEERIKLVGSFADQVMIECETQERPRAKRLVLGRILKSVWKHYCEFVPIVNATKVNLRGPIEKRLKDEVKLAKWDEQSYYALAESAEKSHRKLMKFLREYDNVLETDVKSVLERDFVSGIRSGTEVNGAETEPSTSVPSALLMFPHACPVKKAAPFVATDRKISLSHLRTFRKTWISTNSGVCTSSKYVKGLSKYTKRMHSLLNQDGVKSDLSRAKAGCDAADLLSESLFARLEVLRGDKATRTMKQRALVDLFKALKTNGYSSMKWSIPSQMREMINILQLPIPDEEIFSSNFNSASLKEAESYFQRSTVELSRLQSEIFLIGSQHMSQREMSLMLGFSEHGMLMLAQMRCMIQNLLRNLASIDKLLGAISEAGDSLPMHQDYLMRNITKFDSSYLSGLENMKQLQLLLTSAVRLVDRERSNKLRDIISVVDSCTNRLDSVYRPHVLTSFVSVERLTNVRKGREVLLSVRDHFESCARESLTLQLLPEGMFDSCLEEIDAALEVCLSAEASTTTPTTSIASNDLVSELDSLIEVALVGAQILTKGNEMSPKGSGESSSGSVEAGKQTTRGLWECHASTVNEWNRLNVAKFKCLLSNVVANIRLLHQSEGKESKESRSQYLTISSESCSLVLKVIDTCWDRIVGTTEFFRNAAKFEYIILRVFRNLVAKGFCSDEVEEGGEGNGEGDASKTFEDDVEGTGMGEGDGKNDVTDQIESEEQLLGLKGDEEKEERKEEKKQLNEEEAEQGMEMEADFDGEMYDVPEDKDQDQEVDDDDEEELDREMGEGDDPNENVVDEKMWDNEEDSLGDNNEEEKFEQDSKMRGEAIDDEMRTKEEDEDDKVSPEENDDEKEISQEQEDKDSGTKDEGVEATDGHDEENVNDDLEDKYEDKNYGAEVRDDKDEEMNEENGDDMDLDENLNLNDGGDGDEDEGDTGIEEEDGDMNIDDEGNAGGEEGPDTGEAMEEEEEEAEEESEALQSGTANGVEDADERKEEEDPEPEEVDNADINLKPDKPDQTPEEDAHGIKATSGADAAKQEEDDEEDEDEGKKDADDEDAADGSGAAGDPQESTKREGRNDNQQEGTWEDGEENTESNPRSLDAPNPFRDPGDAEKFWHEKLSMIENDQTEEEGGEADQRYNEAEDAADIPPSNGVFEFAAANQASTTQVLGLATEEEAPEIETEKKQTKEFEEAEKEVGKSADEKSRRDSKKQDKRDVTRDDPDRAESQLGKPSADEANASVEEEDIEEEVESNAIDSSNLDLEDECDVISNGNNSDGDIPENKVVTDLAQLNVGDALNDLENNKKNLKETQHITGFTAAELGEARRRWSLIQAETNILSRRLCEKLRLVMEPLVATKLRGDYRTGKRINMKRVIGYIASGYRKDKIWLKRTKPAKRDYRILLAVDDSESMKKSGAGEMALAAMATLANGMTQLEVGEIGIAAFGEDMTLLHPFNKPFTSESGVALIGNFTFEDKRTRTALCVEGAIEALDSQAGASSSLQLVFMISDGRIERDSRDKLRRLVREMTQRNILLVMIIVEGKLGEEKKKKDSIVNMKEVSFVNGKPKMKQFIEDYPFPYYMVLEDMSSLPEILGDALRQWFEILAQQQLQGMR